MSIEITRPPDRADAILIQLQRACSDKTSLERVEISATMRRLLVCSSLVIRHSSDHLATRPLRRGDNRLIPHDATAEGDPAIQ
jgi:hypothetical protein